MKKYIFILLLLPFLSFSQKIVSPEIMEMKKFQEELNEEYLNPKTTPLRGDNFTNFKGHPFFQFDKKYRVTAKFVKTKNAQPFDLPTSSGKTKSYREYGKATFDLDGKPYTVTLYQSLDLIKQEKYKDHLFLPFRDATNEKETYGGGKYMDLKIPKGNTILLDFNQSYQPFCAYNAYDYNCPIVPAENKLPVEIRAGVKYEDTYHH
ncbi:hypothetical protein C1637_09110 [Chryseobacterium lactis]|uniref:DUF1684 domain-containing protein n=1 Tax=Chryseobacterium lactis TaxID=1241981 RepID=A0A3G6REZ2_CHRLC|nr:DUF1684 domain-containing protein [Chryseobacterium lactis]AZA82316.1 DUF1684 domain-containing protein [Chryseobacterium lactis]AZB02698.1 DUF1684 domain-containing protein [Chryseobacterium lactis]PNW14010.1 hypothetical protein C1637_09110 [Chryseobacterium lactis]